MFSNFTLYDKMQFDNDNKLSIHLILVKKILMITYYKSPWPRLVCL